MSVALYVGGISNGSPSPEATPDLMPAPLALNTPDQCEIVGPDRSWQRMNRGVIVRACGVIWWEPVVVALRLREGGDTSKNECSIVIVAEVTTSKAANVYRSTLEKKLVRTYMPSVELPMEHKCGVANGLLLGTKPSLARWTINALHGVAWLPSIARADMVDRRQSIFGVDSKGAGKGKAFEVKRPPGTDVNGPMTISVVHYRESDVRMNARVSPDHIRRNAMIQPRRYLLASDARGVKEAFRIRPANFGDIVVGIDNIERVFRKVIEGLIEDYEEVAGSGDLKRRSIDPNEDAEDFSCRPASGHVSYRQEAAYDSEPDLLYFESVLSTTTRRTRIRSPFTRSGECDMSIAVYTGGRSNGSPSVETKPDLDGATPMLALLARNTPDPCEIFVDRDLGGGGRGGVEEPGPGSGDAGLAWLGMMGNGGIGGFVDNGVGGTGGEPRAGMLERHRSISGVASEGCRRATGSGIPDERELEEGRPFEDNTPRDKSERFPSSRK
ncbi:hypothetical protein EDB89DRAFT_1907381 [Lactarius sanguifluus]|nr:hypothetical protein EDB89DRAFT_1907381 [Lactarius sanguifluus]